MLYRLLLYRRKDMLKRMLFPDELEQQAQETSSQNKFLETERKLHPNEVTDREISLLSNLLSKQELDVTEITDMIAPTIERKPTKEHFATLMRETAAAQGWRYWAELYRCQEGKNSDAKELGKNIILAAANVTQAAPDLMGDEKNFPIHHLIDFYHKLIEHRPNEEGKLSTNSELTTLMVSELDKKLKETEFNKISDYEISQTQKFLAQAAPICSNNSKGLSKCEGLMDTYHNIQIEKLKADQKEEKGFLRTAMKSLNITRSNQNE